MTTDDVRGRPNRRMVAPGRKHDQLIVSLASPAEEVLRPTSPIRGHLAVSGIAAVERGQTILDDLSFELVAGSINYLIGSTPQERGALLTFLLGLETPSEGTIHLDGVGLEEMSRTDRRTMVGLAVTDPWMVAGTIAENIAFGHPTVSREQVDWAAKLACVDSFAVGLDDGLDTGVSEEGHELTTAERRLIGMARAVVRQPALLLIDRPTAGLDNDARSTARRAVAQVSAGRTTLIAAQRPNLVEPADRVLRIRGGHLVGPDRDPATNASDTDRVRSRAFRRLGSTRSVSAIKAGEEFIVGLQAIHLVERSAHTESWVAWDRDEGRLVSVKLPRRSPATYVALEELTHEYRTSEHLTHPGLNRPLYDQFALAHPYSVYEHLQGPTLADLIGSAQDRPDSGTILRIGYELARTLTYVHKRGFAHLDLRPEIVVVSPHGTVITDLKMALRLGDEQVRFYHQNQYSVLAAEQLRGGPAAAAMDIFALGALLHQAANGVLAATTTSSFKPKRASIDNRPPRRRPPKRSWTSRGLRALDHRSHLEATDAVSILVEQLTASDPKQRPSAEEVLNLIRPHIVPEPQARDSTAGSMTSPIGQVAG